MLTLILGLLDGTASESTVKDDFVRFLIESEFSDGDPVTKNEFTGQDRCDEAESRMLTKMSEIRLCEMADLLVHSMSALTCR